MQNKQPRLQTPPPPPKNRRSKSIKTQVQSEDWKKKQAFVVRSQWQIGILDLKKGENKAQAQRKNRNYLVTKVYYMFNTKKVWRKMYLY